MHFFNVSRWIRRHTIDKLELSAPMPTAPLVLLTIWLESEDDDADREEKVEDNKDWPSANALVAGQCSQVRGQLISGGAGTFGAAPKAPPFAEAAEAAPEFECDMSTTAGNKPLPTPPSELSSGEASASV